MTQFTAPLTRKRSTQVLKTKREELTASIPKENAAVIDAPWKGLPRYEIYDACSRMMFGWLERCGLFVLSIPLHMGVKTGC